MLDEAFVKVFEKSNIDYLIWYAPYKRFEHMEPPLELPKACIYRVGELLPVEHIYEAEKMVSVER